MHCPNCGTKASLEHKFCRACGLGLEGVSQALAEQLRSEPDVLAPDGARQLAERQQRVEWWLGAATLGFVSLFVGSLSIAIIYGLIISRGEVLKGLVLLLFILAATFALGLVYYNESLKEELGKGRRPDPAPPQRADTARLLPESRIEPVPSVTERTTDLLAVEKGAGSRGS